MERRLERGVGEDGWVEIETLRWEKKLWKKLVEGSFGEGCGVVEDSGKGAW